MRLYDLLIEGDDDLRALPWTDRRTRLEAYMAQLPSDRFDLSALIEAAEDIKGVTQAYGT